MSKRRLPLLAALVAMMAVALALQVPSAFATDLNIPLNNATAEEGTDCPATGGPYWHFVISPNSGDSYFITFHLNLGDATTYDTSIYVPNGSQLDNVFVEVPSGKTLTSLIKVGSSADISWNGDGGTPTKFQLSHVCSGGTTPPADDLSVSKDANGSYDDTFSWTITKAVDKTIVKQVGGNATFNYTVTVSHGDSEVSNVKVSGTIAVTNPNDDSVDIDGIADELSDGTDCTVTGGGAQSLPSGQSEFGYECALSGLPDGDLTNTVTVSWSDQTIDDGQLDAGTATFTSGPISFTATEIDTCVDVTDSFAGADPPDTLGTVCVGDDNPYEFKYPRTVPVPQFDCVDYDNTATFTTNDTGTEGSASQTVTVCGPARTGALTIGFWQNKNGQAIIGSYSGTNCQSLRTWLNAFAPFADLTATNCTNVKAYVTNVIKAASASGAAMNAMLKAQMLATALDVYFSDPALGGNRINAPAPIGGVAIDLTYICKNIATCTIYEDTSSAFGGATSLTVSQMLAYAASQSNPGGSVWYGQVKATQELAKDAFDAVNNQVAFAP